MPHVETAVFVFVDTAPNSTYQNRVKKSICEVCCTGVCNLSLVTLSLTKLTLLMSAPVCSPRGEEAGMRVCLWERREEVRAKVSDMMLVDGGNRQQRFPLDSDGNRHCAK